MYLTFYFYLSASVGGFNGHVLKLPFARLWCDYCIRTSKKNTERRETCERADSTGKTPTSLVGKGQGWRLLETQQGGRKESPQADICAPGKQTAYMVQEDRRRCWQHSSSDTTCWEPGSDVQLEKSREVSLLETLVRKNVQGLNEARLRGRGDASMLMACFGGSVWYVMLMAFLVTEKCNGEERWRDGDACREPALVYVCLSVRRWPGSLDGIHLTIQAFCTVLHRNKSPSPSCTASAEKYVYLDYNSFQFSTHI